MWLGANWWQYFVQIVGLLIYVFLWQFVSLETKWLNCAIYTERWRWSTCSWDASAKIMHASRKVSMKLKITREWSTCWISGTSLCNLAKCKSREVWRSRKVVTYQVCHKINIAGMGGERKTILSTWALQLHSDQLILWMIWGGLLCFHFGWIQMIVLQVNWNPKYVFCFWCNVKD